MAATGRPNGRPKKPVEQQRALGNPGHRAIPAAPLPGKGLKGASDVPKGPVLGPAGSALWLHVWRAGRTWLAVEADRTLVTMLCQAEDEMFAMRNAFLNGEVERTYVTSNGTIVSHPYITQMKDLRVQMTSWLSALGFSPADRARLGLAEVRVRDELDDLAQKRVERFKTA